MPNRILKESICTSESIDSLSWFEEVLFYRLVVNCDDFGRFDGRPAVIKARLFPLKDRMTVKDVANALSKLADAGIVRMYACDNKPYLYLPTWRVHQSPRAAKSKYPDPEGEESEIICKQLQADDFKCKQMQADAPVSDIRYSRTDTRYSGTDNRSSADDALPFDDFWKAYPKKAAKQDALKAFKKLSDEEKALLLPAIERQKKSKQWQEDGGKFIPYPATWLNGKRWNDEVSADATDKDAWKQKLIDDFMRDG